MSDYKYLVDVMTLEKPMRVPREVVEQIKGALGRKLIRRMKLDAVNCPVTGKLTPFLVCFSCKNFVRRVSGKVYCRGLPLS
ncbi:MAG: hypothetical protein NDF55_02355 [archaeon GB-1867-005]|nr:hypothetical protein [Candidatus Culexmicrobium cathedralense]